MSRVIALVPARSGSKGVPDKNVRLLGGVPLFVWSIKSATESKADIVIFNSDSDKYLDLCDARDVIKLQRPESLGGDHVLTADVVKYSLDAVSASPEDIIILLQPTCPFRSSNEIDRAIEILKNDSDAAVISVVNVGGNHPLRMKRIVNGRLINYIDSGFEDMRPRQDLPDVYIRSGSIYGCSVANFQKNGTFGADHVIPIVDDPLTCINIDTEFDFLLAEKLAASGKG